MTVNFIQLHINAPTSEVNSIGHVLAEVRRVTSKYICVTTFDIDTFKISTVYRFLIFGSLAHLQLARQPRLAPLIVRRLQQTHPPAYIAPFRWTPPSCASQFRSLTERSYTGRSRVNRCVLWLKTRGHECSRAKLLSWLELWRAGRNLKIRAVILSKFWRARYTELSSALSMPLQHR